MKKVIKYGTTWCMPCRAMENVIDQAKENYPDILFETIDIGLPENECLIQDLKIVSVPTIIAYNEDKVVSKTTGYLPYPAFEEIIKNLINDEL